MQKNTGFLVTLVLSVTFVTYLIYLTLSNSFLYQINLPPLLEAEEEDERPDGAAILTTSATAAAPLAD